MKKLNSYLHFSLCLLFILFYFFSFFTSFAQPGNDNCPGTALVVNDPCIAGTTVASNVEGGEYINCNGGGSEDQSVWYSFTASNSTMYLHFSSWVVSCTGVAAVYGPNPSCVPGVGSLISCNNITNTIIRLTALTVTATYYVQVHNKSGGGGCGTGATFCIKVNEPQANDGICGATTITINAACSVQSNYYSDNVSEPADPTCWSGSSTNTEWFKFVANNDSMVLNSDFKLDYYNNTSYGMTDGVMAVYSSSDNTCTGALTEIACDHDGGLFQSLMPYLFLTGLNVGDTYFIRFAGWLTRVGDFCFQVHEPCKCISNDCVWAASLIDECGTAFSDATNGTGHEGLSPASWLYTNIDCNNSTDPSAAGGGDIPWSIENDTWFYFCPGGSTSTWTVSANVPVGGCSLGCGATMAIFQGSPFNLSTRFDVVGDNTSCTNAIEPGETYTNDYSINPANGCVYIVMDGYSGSICSYNLTITCAGCCSLPIELLYFSGQNKGALNILQWATTSEINNDYFTLEHSTDAVNYETLAKIEGRGNSSVTAEYFYAAENYLRGKKNYYKLKQTDFDGTTSYTSTIVVIDNKNSTEQSVTVNFSDRNLVVNFSNAEEVIYELSVYDINGKLVLSEKLNSSVENPGQTHEKKLANQS